MNNDRPFVIWSLGFSASVGGSIVLHYLCHLLNSMGHQAYIWPGARWPNHSIGTISENRNIEIAQRVWRIAKNKIRRDTFYLHPDLQTPVARPEDIENAIVVYPEIVDGNPLGCERVVRWFLHKPGYHTGAMNFGENDLRFYYQEYFIDDGLNKTSEDILRVRWLRDDIYSQQNFHPRSGTCYMIRKGQDRPDVAKPSQSKRLDNYGHRKVADIFNQKKLFFSYDLYTMYCTYAAMCGCIPVVVPRRDVEIQDWRANPQDRYGIAYGEGEIDWAIETRPKLIERIYKEKQEEANTVLSFASRCYNYFG
jgi:hypothetical protein